MSLPTILFASGNRHKFEELKRLWPRSDVRLCFGGDLCSLEVAETGESYAANALLKARAWSRRTGLPCLADDSGLEVESLGWKPGLFSSRIAEDDPSRIKWVLENLKENSHRIARFVACLALVLPDKREIWLCEAYCWGEIAFAPAGVEGFGYDPIFIPEGCRQTFGELGEKVKSQISHRARAAKGLSAMLPSVVEYITALGTENARGCPR